MRGGAVAGENVFATRIGYQNRSIATQLAGVALRRHRENAHHVEAPRGDLMSTQNQPASPPGGSKKQTPMPRRVWITFAVVVVANYLMLRLFVSPPQRTAVAYSTFVEEAGRGNVSEIQSRGDRVTGRFAHPVTLPAADSGTTSTPRTVTDFTTTIPAFAGRGLESLLVAHGTKV